VVDGFVQLPATVIDAPLPADKVIFLLDVVQLKLAHETAVAAASVTVKSAAPDEFVKNTLSAVVGAEDPDAPPSESDQLAVELLFHVPVPPTQYLSGIRLPFQ
jgi:hypothetical protein